MLIGAAQQQFVPAGGRNLLAVRIHQRQRDPALPRCRQQGLGVGVGVEAQQGIARSQRVIKRLLRERLSVRPTGQFALARLNRIQPDAGRTAALDDIVYTSKIAASNVPA